MDSWEVAVWAERSWSLTVTGGKRFGSQRFGSLFDAEQHPAGHDECRGLHDAHPQPPERRVRHTLRAARKKSCALLVEPIQTELPHCCSCVEAERGCSWPVRAVGFREVGCRA